MDAEYKDVNESAPIPSLTLEPELENTPKLVVAEETKLQQTKVAEPVLTPQEQTAQAAECVFAFLQKGNAA